MENETLPPTPPTVVAASPPPSAPLLKKPWLAFVLAGFPGIGHVYNGLYVRGLTFFIICGTLLALVVDQGELFGFVLAFFWIFNMLDSYRQAVLINYGYAQDLGLIDLPARPKLVQGGLVAGVIVFLVGLAAFLERFLNVDLSLILDLWPVGFMLIGVWLVVAAIRNRRKAPEGLGEGAGSLLT